MSQREARGVARVVPSGADILVRQAGFIFAGTVRRLNGATMADVPTERAAVVRVDSTLSGPRLLDAYVGREVTLQLRDPEGVGVGHAAVFFARGWIYGSGLALRELERWPINDNLTRLRRDVVEAQQRLADGELRRRLADAALVVAGRVAQTAELAPRDERLPRREHEPRWVEAVISVDVVLRGDRDRRSVAVLFASSRDVAWRTAPKLRVGQAGIWVLHERPIEGHARMALALTDPRDAQPLEQRRRIEALMATVG